jgi:peroxiredoxin
MTATGGPGRWPGAESPLLLAAVAAEGLAVAVLALATGRLRRELAGLREELRTVAAQRVSAVPRTGLATGSAAPQLSLATPDGGRVELADFAGRRLLLLFVSPHCRPCHGLLRALAADPGLGGRVDAVLAVSNAAPADNAALAAATGVPFPLLSEERRAVSRPYAALALPSFCLVDGDGRVAASGPVEDIAHLRRLLPGGDGGDGGAVSALRDRLRAAGRFG